MWLYSYHGLDIVAYSMILGRIRTAVGVALSCGASGWRLKPRLGARSARHEARLRGLLRRSPARRVPSGRRLRGRRPPAATYELCGNVRVCRRAADPCGHRALPRGTAPPAYPTKSTKFISRQPTAPVEMAEPILDDRARALNFTNEGGVAGTICHPRARAV